MVPRLRLHTAVSTQGTLASLMLIANVVAGFVSNSLLGWLIQVIAALSLMVVYDCYIDYSRYRFFCLKQRLFLPAARAPRASTAPTAAAACETAPLCC